MPLCFFGFAEDHAWEVSEYIADACDVTAVHSAPVCRIPMSNGGLTSRSSYRWCTRSDWPNPGFYDADHLLVVPDMIPLDRMKFKAANRLMKDGQIHAMAGFERHLWELENPTNGLVVSHIFSTGSCAQCHACAHGSPDHACHACIVTDFI